MRPAPPVLLDSHAAASLRYIRASIEAAATLAVPGSAGILMGLIGLTAAVLSSLPALQSRWLEIWLLAAFAAAGAGSLLMARQSARQGFTLLGAPVRKLLLCLLPGLLAGAILSVMLYRVGSVGLLPATWLLLYGCALISASATTRPIVGVLGSLFVLLALLTFFVPARAHLLLLGAGFGGLHLLFGVLIARNSHGREG